jgi:hypothetical protein
MSAFDKVREAKEAAETAQHAALKAEVDYKVVIADAATAISEKRFDDAARLLDAIGFEQAGEDPAAYQKLWLAALPFTNQWETSTAFDVDAWRFVRERAPVEATTGIQDFFHRALSKGSSEILNDLVHHYNEADDKWQRNWNTSILLGTPTRFAGHEDELVERLKCVDLLVEGGAPANRLYDVMIRLPQYARETENLSEGTLQEMDKRYAVVLDVCVQQGHLRFLLPEEYHIKAPASMPVSHARYNEEQEKFLASQKPLAKAARP